MRVLIYTPTNSRAVDLQSVMELFVTMGHEVYLLSQIEQGDLHANVKQYGVKTFGSDRKGHSGMGAYAAQVRSLISFTREHKINIVFAHLQSAGLVAGIARKFSDFKLYYVRHNTDEHKIQGSRKAGVINSLTNRIVPAIIAPSKKVYNYLVSEEKVSPSKIIRINYGYNFSQYMLTDKTGNAAEIRKSYDARLLLLSAARLIPAKRHLIMFEAVRKLVQERKRDVTLLCLGEGPFRDELQQYIDDNGLQKNIYLLGAKKNVIDYMEAADVFFHLSQTEASNSAVKEAGFCKKPAIVCSGVGDFEDYIEDSVNGFLLNKSAPLDGAVTVLDELYNNSAKIQETGMKFYNTIVTEFDISRLREAYSRLIQ